MKQKAEQHREKTQKKTLWGNNDEESGWNGEKVHPLNANKKFTLQIVNMHCILCSAIEDGHFHFALSYPYLSRAPSCLWQIILKKLHQKASATE